MRRILETVQKKWFKIKPPKQVKLKQEVKSSKRSHMKKDLKKVFVPIIAVEKKLFVIIAYTNRTFLNCCIKTLLSSVSQK